jgi:uncharacterized membrane protein YvbJ
MFCKSCGAQIKEGARFCPKCGEAVSVLPQITQPATDWRQSAYPQSIPQGEGRNIPLLIAALFGVLCMIAVASGESFLNAILESKIAKSQF